jgi:glycosyltransferase involved in cell wall biosynthesis
MSTLQSSVHSSFDPKALRASIVICSAGDRSHVLEETLDSALVAAKDDCEVLVVASPLKWATLYRAGVAWVECCSNNVSAARNAGAHRAQSEILFFIDDDILISRLNVEQMLSHYELLRSGALVNAVWVHSPKVQYLKSTDRWAQMISRRRIAESFEGRYRLHHRREDWQACLFLSGMEREISEACFAISRERYFVVNGMDESFRFGHEGADLLRRLKPFGTKYYIDPCNKVLHNEWDKFTKPEFLPRRKIDEAICFNQQIMLLPLSGWNPVKKVIYGVALSKCQSVLYCAIRFCLRVAPSKSDPLFDIYLQTFFWQTLTWSTVNLHGCLGIAYDRIHARFRRTWRYLRSH